MRILLRFLVAFLLVFVAGFAHAESVDESYYTIKWGDNLTKIAKKFDTTVESLVAINNIANPNYIRAESIIRVVEDAKVGILSIEKATTVSCPSASGSNMSAIENAYGKVDCSTVTNVAPTRSVSRAVPAKQKTVARMETIVVTSTRSSPKHIACATPSRDMLLALKYRGGSATVRAPLVETVTKFVSHRQPADSLAVMLARPQVHKFVAEGMTPPHDGRPLEDAMLLHLQYPFVFLPELLERKVL